jgi:hypothetical protein
MNKALVYAVQYIDFENPVFGIYNRAKGFALIH